MEEHPEQESWSTDVQLDTFEPLGRDVQPQIAHVGAPELQFTATNTDCPSADGSQIAWDGGFFDSAYLESTPYDLFDTSSSTEVANHVVDDQQFPPMTTTANFDPLPDGGMALDQLFNLDPALAFEPVDLQWSPLDRLDPPTLLGGGPLTAPQAIGAADPPVFPGESFPSVSTITESTPPPLPIADFRGEGIFSIPTVPDSAALPLPTVGFPSVPLDLAKILTIQHTSGRDSRISGPPSDLAVPRRVSMKPRKQFPSILPKLPPDVQSSSPGRTLATTSRAALNMTTAPELSIPSTLKYQDTVSAVFAQLYYDTQDRSAFETNYMKLLRASRIIMGTNAKFILNSGYPRAIATFAYFRLTGVPASEVRTRVGKPLFKPGRPHIRPRVLDPNVTGHDAGLWDFLVAATQTRDLARLAGLNPRDAEVWLSLVSEIQIRYLGTLLAKFRRGQASTCQKRHLMYKLCAILFASEFSGAYALEAADEYIIDVFGNAEWDWELVSRAIGVIAHYVLTVSERKTYLRLWARYWLRKLCGGSYDELGSAATMMAAMSCLSLDPGLEPSIEERAAEPGVDQNNDNTDDTDDNDNYSDDGDGDDHGEGEGIPLDDLAVLRNSVLAPELCWLLTELGNSGAYYDARKLRNEFERLAPRNFTISTPPHVPTSNRTAELDSFLEHTEGRQIAALIKAACKDARRLIKRVGGPHQMEMLAYIEGVLLQIKNAWPLSKGITEYWALTPLVADWIEDNSPFPRRYSETNS
ncbi:hypothetical protein DL765_007229 [Monosporascus sp. GIB2]|nr:hypothetical protein DL765_007229 [Monosporascus sp. GIB2]